MSEETQQQRRGQFKTLTGLFPSAAGKKYKYSGKVQKDTLIKAGTYLMVFPNRSDKENAPPFNISYVVNDDESDAPKQVQSEPEELPF